MGERRFSPTVVPREPARSLEERAASLRRPVTVRVGLLGPGGLSTRPPV